ncbi:MAG: Flp family type IVb pilin [Xanthobacteraceae bacterium]
MRTRFAQFAREESGATTVVYGLIAAGLSIAIIMVMSGLGSKLNATLAWMHTALQ